MRMFVGKRLYREVDAYAGQPVIPGRLSIKSGWLRMLLIKYWIVVVAAALLLVAMRTPVVVVGICYMVFFVAFVTTLQVSSTRTRMFNVIICCSILAVFFHLAFHALLLLAHPDRIFGNCALARIHLSVPASA